MDYKGIKYKQHPEISAIEISIDGEYDVDQVLKATRFTELAGFLKPENVIVDRTHSERPPDVYIKFLEERLFIDLLDYGVKRIFIILKKKDRDLALKKSGTLPPYLTLCGSVKEVFNELGARRGPRIN